MAPGRARSSLPTRRAGLRLALAEYSRKPRRLATAKGRAKRRSLWTVRPTFAVAARAMDRAPRTTTASPDTHVFLHRSGEWARARAGRRRTASPASMPVSAIPMSVWTASAAKAVVTGPVEAVVCQGLWGSAWRALPALRILAMSAATRARRPVERMGCATAVVFVRGTRWDLPAARKLACRAHSHRRRHAMPPVSVSRRPLTPAILISATARFATTLVPATARNARRTSSVSMDPAA